MEDGKFHPHTDYKKGVRKSRDQKLKTQGVKIRKRKDRDVVIKFLDNEDREVNDPIEKQQILDQLSRAERDEWESVVGSQVVKVKHEMMNGRPITSIRFANGEEWFEFESFSHQEEFIKENKIDVDESITGEFVEIEHPDIAGFITMESGSILFGEREGRKKRDGTVLKQQITFFEDPSHGFYRVPRSLLIDLGIDDKITSFSKRQGDIVFLEEDADATLFFNTLKKKGIDVPEDKIKTKYFDSANENPASIDFGLCDECGRSFGSAGSMMKHKQKEHTR